MKITKIDITGFGKWVNQSFEVSPSLHVFYGQNESGKSTLVAFIQAIFFGFPTRSQSENRYEPKTSSEYGGRIQVKDSKYGDVTLERFVQTKVSGEGKLIVDQDTILNEQAFPDFFSQINQNLYRQIYLFTLSDLEKIRQLKPQELEGNFLNLSVSGASDYLKLAEKLEKDASDLYKPSGRVPALNQAIKRLKEVDHQLKQAQAQNTDYLNHLDRLEAIDQKLNQINDMQAKEKAEADQVSYYLNHWDKVERYQFLNQAISQQGQMVGADDRQSFQDLFAESQSLSHQIDQLNQDLKDLQSENLTDSHNLDQYLMNKENYDAVFAKLESMQALSDRYQNKQGILTEKNKAHQQLADQLGLSKEEANQVEKFSEPDQEKLQAWKEDLEDKNQKIHDIDKELYKLDYQLSLESEEKDTHQKTSATSLILPLVVGLIAFFLLFLFDLPIALSLIVGLLAGGMGYLVTNRGKTDYQDSNEVSDANQDALRLQKQYEKEKQEIRKTIDQIQAGYQAFLENHGLPGDIKIDQAINQLGFYNQLVDQASELKDLHQDQERTYQKLLDQGQMVDSYVDEFKTYSNPIVKLYHLSQFKSDIDDYLQADSDLMQAINLTSKELAEKNTQADTVDRKLNNLMAAYGESSIVQFKKMISQSETSDRYQSERETLRDFFAHQTKEETENSEQPIDYLDYHQLESKLTGLKEGLADMLNQKDQLIEEKSSLKMAMAELEEGGNYSRILQVFENQKSLVMGLIDDWLALKLGADIIQDTIKMGIQDQLPAIIDRASDYFNRLTHQRYTGILLKDDQIQVQRHDQSIFNVKELSRGTAEPLYTALRLAMIDHRSHKVQLPILVDDSFVNLDSNRKAVIYDILEEISDHTQVLLFTFDQKAVERFASKQVTKLQ